MWIRFLMLGVTAFFSITAFTLVTFQGVEFGHAFFDLIRNFYQNKS